MRSRLATIHTTEVAHVRPSYNAEDRPDYDRRPGTDRAASDVRVTGALDDLAAATDAVSARAPGRPPYLRSGRGVSLHALGITPELVNTGRVDLRGHVRTAGIHSRRHKIIPSGCV